MAGSALYQRLVVTVLMIEEQGEIDVPNPTRHGAVLQTIADGMEPAELVALLKMVKTHCERNLKMLETPQIIVPGPGRSQ